MANYELNRHKKSDKVRWFFTAVAFVLVFVLIAGICLQMFGEGKWKPSEWFKDQTEQEQPAGDEAADNGGAVIGESAGTGMQLMSAKIATDDYAEYGISPMAETAHTITATVEPVGATYKQLKWTSAWSSSGGWASGKNVSDYVTVKPNEDTLSAVVECKAPFGVQITVTAAYVHDENVKASCTVDYKQKYVGTFSGEISLDKSSGNKATFSNSNTRVSILFPLKNEDHVDLSFLDTRKGEIKCTLDLSDTYTIPASVSLKGGYIKLSSNMNRAFSEYPAGFSTISGDYQVIDGSSVLGGIVSASMRGMMGIKTYDRGNPSTVKSKLGGFSDCYYEYKLNYMVNNKDENIVIRVLYDRSSLATPMTNVELSDSSIIF